MDNKKRNLFITQFGYLLAIEAIVCFTPLGSLPIGPIVATLSMLPVIITAILLGTKAGMLMGGFFGLFSFIVWTFMPPNPAFAFVFTPFTQIDMVSGNVLSLLICFVPRILIGFTTGVIYNALNKKIPQKAVVSFSISAIAGSLTNTFGVLGGIWLFFGSQYSSLAGELMVVIVGTTILINGSLESVISAFVSSAVCRPIKRIYSQKANS